MVHRFFAFAALGDPTRLAILERLARGSATVTELAEQAGLTLTGARKHIRVLESAELVVSSKVGRVRWCSLGPRRLEVEAAWIAKFRRIALRVPRGAQSASNHRSRTWFDKE